MAFRRRRKNEFHLVYDNNKKKITPQIIREVLSWVFYTVVAIVIAAMLVYGFGKNVELVGDSMEPRPPLHRRGLCGLLSGAHRVHGRQG